MPKAGIYWTTLYKQNPPAQPEGLFYFPQRGLATFLYSGRAKIETVMYLSDFFDQMVGYGFVDQECYKGVKTGLDQIKGKKNGQQHIIHHGRGNAHKNRRDKMIG